MSDWQDVITVNMLGKRFYDETGRQFTANSYKGVDPYSHGSYLNAKNVRFDPNNWINAAMAGIGDGHNGGGPIWAIFDAAAVEREKWDPKPPNVDIDGGFFFAADTVAELAKKIKMKYQRVRDAAGEPRTDGRATTTASCGSAATSISASRARSTGSPSRRSTRRGARR